MELMDMFASLSATVNAQRCHFAAADKWLTGAGDKCDKNRRSMYL